jgi:serine/threonine protein kinase
MEKEQNHPVQFGKYQILEELGKGGFGTVYRVRETVLNVERAIKVLHPNLLTDETFLTRFKREAQVSAHLEHSNIVPVYELDQVGGMNYIAMKYMSAGSLAGLLRKQGPLNPDDVLRFFEDICAGVHFAHQNGVIHRDLKPSNLLIDEFNNMRVSDFGFAKTMAAGVSASMSSSGNLIGTPAYMAPEIWRGKPATAQSDIYSLGCILYEMLTGKVLFEGESPAEVITKHVIDGPVYGEGLPKPIRSVLEMALRRDLKERYFDAKDLLEGFKSALKPDEFTLTSETEEDKLDATHEERIQTTLRGHTDAVISVTWSPDGKTLASGSWDHTIILWDMGSGTKLRTLEGHTSTVYTVAWSPDGKMLASGSFFTIILWDTQSGSQLRTLEGHTGTVDSIAWSPDGKTLASGGYDNTIIFWEPASGSQLRTLKGHTSSVNCVAWSPDGKTLASGSHDKTIILWDTQSGNQLYTLKGHTHGVASIAWSSDGRTLASGSYDNTVILWYPGIGSQLCKLKGHESGVASVAWSPDGKTLASGSYQSIILWDAGSGSRLRTLEGHTNAVMSVAWSPDGKTLASGSYDSTIRLWGFL